MLLKGLRSRLEAVENRLTLICEELDEIRLMQKREGPVSSEETSCASLIDEWVNGREEK
ncbi:MAG: hypothetical protein IJ445_05840 [Clostridia bacterium]|nr:hypothetical protein [Clostridia bacterium]